jgi:hypothetical protein
MGEAEKHKNSQADSIVKGPSLCTAPDGHLAIAETIGRPKDPWETHGRSSKHSGQAEATGSTAIEDKSAAGRR